MDNNILNSAYERALHENSTNLSFYETFKEDYENLMKNLSTFRDTLEPDILVPVCNRVLMRGNLNHTNEVMVSLGCGYFTKCCVRDAQDICRRRIAKADGILRRLEGEKEYLENQINFKSENVFSSDLKEIIEPYDEAAEEEWRKKHSLRMKEHRIQENATIRSMDHEDVVQKLELLELQEDIDRLYVDQKKNISADPSDMIKETNDLDYVPNPESNEGINNDKIIEIVDIMNSRDESKENMLRKKLSELKQRIRVCNTEDDVMRRLDELEEEEEIEDELEKLCGYVNEDEDEETEIEECSSEEDMIERPNPTGRQVTFPKSNVEIQTININFTHSKNNPETKTQQDENSVTSPSDVYKLFPENFNKTNELKGIIKNCHRVKEEIHQRDAHETNGNNECEREVLPTATVNIGDVLENNATPTVVKVDRPVSKFKSMRMANKKK